ncbi:MAG: arylsulfotransferase family protein [Woeseia sp.]
MNQRVDAHARGKRRTSAMDRFFTAAFIVAVATLLFVGGSLATAVGVTPGPQIARAYEGGKAFYAKLFYHDDVYQSDLWYSARTDKRGVTINDPARTSPGVTLFTSGHEPAAYLISMEGEVLHEWQRPFSRIWNDSAAVKRPQPDSHVYMRKAMVDSNGDLLAIYEGAGDTPYGYGLVKLDKDSNVIWSYLQPAHHDFDVAPDGRIFVLTQEIVDSPLPQLEHLASPRLDDFIVILSPDGEELRKIPLLPVVDESDYRQLLFEISSFARADALHTNSVHVITEKEAETFGYGKAGQILVSFREPGAVGVVDLDEEKLIWAVKGYWSGQHDPHIMDNGNILLFDNRGNFRKPEGRSRVLEFDPATMAIIWQYTGTDDSPLQSDIRSYSQRLPNGNTLITESNGGRILEVTQAQEIVWEYVNPVRGGPRKQKIPILCKALRLDASIASAFLSNSLES